MKICLVHHEYPEETSMGGIATYQHLLAKELVRLGNEVTVISAAIKDDQDYFEDGVHIIRYNKCIQYDTVEYMTDYRIRVANKLHELYLENKIDIIESPEMGAECLMYINKYHDVPVVCKLHTSFELWAEFNDTTLPKVVHNTLVSWEQEYIKKADAVTSCTKLLYQMMIDRNQINRRDVIVLGNPLNDKNFEPIDIEQDDSILYLGGLEQRKGVLTLARAIPIILDKYPKVIFRFIGADTPSNDKNILTSEYIKEIVPKKYHKNLDFVGHIENSEVNYYCNKSVIGVIPSRFDNLPYVAMEEILSGLPIVASDNTGIKEMITDEKSGLLFKNDDVNDLAKKVIKLYSNKRLQEQFKINAREEIINKYSPNKIALATLDVYQDCINKFFIKKNIINYSKIERIPLGVANFVYKISNEINKDKVVKMYRIKPNNCNITIIEYDRSDNRYNIKENENKRFDNILVMDYIDGVHKDNLDTDDIKDVLHFMNYYHESNHVAGIKTLYDKIILFSNFCNENSNVYNSLKSFWRNNKDEIEKLLKKELTYSHGDLSKSNIIFSKNNIYYIDFDETVFAPRYYDLAVFIVKNCHNNGTFNTNLFEDIISLYENINDKKIERKELLLTIKIYLYKVLMEKMYWSSKKLIDLNDNNQKKDYYLNYYKLFREL